MSCHVPRSSLQRGLILALMVSTGLGQVRYKIVPEKSKIKIHLGTAGLFGFFGDEHLIEAAVAGGTIRYNSDDIEQSSVQLTVMAVGIQVVDPNLQEEDRRKVQETMDSERVLDIQNHPEIAFQSVQVKKTGENKLILVGDLTILGRTHEVEVRSTIESTRPEWRSKGMSRFKQTTFGIKPVTAGAGTVRVKDEIEVTFDLVAIPE